MASEELTTTCCVVGGGPAGMMLGYLLARSGIAVTVLEKHNDFLRDFRGDTVHPSTLEVLHELDLLEDFLKIPHQKLTSVSGVFGDFSFEAANFRYVPARCRFIALMPQWDFLNFLAARAKRFSSFELRMQHEAAGLLLEDGRVTGVEARTPDGSVQIRAGLVVGCDGRHAVTREAAGLEVVESGVPIDVLWFRLSRKQTDQEQLFGMVNYGKALVLVNRGSYFQTGFIIRKGGFDQMKSRGLDAFRAAIAQIAPFLADRVGELRDWDQVKLLSVQINRLRTWHRPGLLCIGDAAHAMSPAGGVGINLAIQDAVATANLLAAPLSRGRVTDAALAEVQRRRELPTRVTQGFQVMAHKGFEYVFRHPGAFQAPWPLKAVARVPGAPHVVGRFIGLGVRPEHIAGARGRNPLTRIAVGAGIAVAVAVNILRGFRSRRAASVG